MAPTFPHASIRTSRLLAAVLVACLAALAVLACVPAAHAATLYRGDVNRAASGGIVLDRDLHVKAPAFNVPVTEETIPDTNPGYEDTRHLYSVALDVPPGGWVSLGRTVTARWSDVGFDADDDRIDLVLTFLPDTRYYSNGSYSAYYNHLSSVILLERYERNAWGTAGICLPCNSSVHTPGVYSSEVSSEAHVRINFYKAGTTTPAKGSFLTKFTDLDQPGWGLVYGNRWVESVEFIKGHGAMYVPSSNVLEIGANRSGEANCDYRATRDMSGSSLDSGVVTNLSNGAEYWFHNTWGGTDILDQFNPHVIKMSAGAGGRVHTRNKTGEVVVGWRASRTITITPNTGYVVKDVVVDGKSVGAKTSYTFSDVTSDHTISATFSPISYSVSFSGNGATAGSMKDQAMTYDKAANLSQNAYSRTYSVTYDSHGGSAGTGTLSNAWTFAGWTAKADGTGASYADRQAVKNLASTQGARVPVHARWTPADSALPDPGDRESLSWRGKDYPAYGFRGWYTQASGGTRVGGAGDAFRVDATAHAGYLANGSTIHARWECRYALVTYVCDPGTAWQATYEAVEAVPAGVGFAPSADATSWAQARAASLGNGTSDRWYSDAAGTVPFETATFAPTPEGQVAEVTLYAFSCCDVELANGGVEGGSSPSDACFGADSTGGATASLDAISGLPATIADVRLGSVLSFSEHGDSETVTATVAGGEAQSVSAPAACGAWCYGQAREDGGGWWHPYRVAAEPLVWHRDAQCADAGSASVLVDGNLTLFKRWVAGGYEGVRGR